MAGLPLPCKVSGMCLATVLIQYAGLSLAQQDRLLELEGNYIQGGLVFGRVEAGSSVVFGGESTRVSENGDFIVGFNRDEPGTVGLTVTYPDGVTVRRTLNVDKREYDTQYIEGVPQETVTPPASAMERINREAAEIGATRKHDDARLDFLDDWQWPVTGPISGVYGSQRYYNGEPRRPHYGVDVARPIGTPVHAPAAGVVTFSNPDTYYSGGLVILDHGHGLSSAFLHLSEALVDVGQRVEQGELLGKVGVQGRSTGPHLDWRMNLFQRRIDPALLVEPMVQE
jgi:murein DD-endopeptidase MepM/ murein hydrolase activator NlpD